MSYSNHCPIWLTTLGTRFTRKDSKLFQHETMWVKESKCYNIVDDVWSLRGEQGSIENIIYLISKCGITMSQWNKSKFGNVQQRLSKANQALRRAQRDTSSFIIMRKSPRLGKRFILGSNGKKLYGSNTLK